MHGSIATNDEATDNRRPDMSKTTVASQQVSHDSKAHGCCGGDEHAKDLGTEPVARTQSTLAGDRKHEHTPQSGPGSGCCGGGRRHGAAAEHRAPEDEAGH